MQVINYGSNCIFLACIHVKISVNVLVALGSLVSPDRGRCMTCMSLGGWGWGGGGFMGVPDGVSNILNTLLLFLLLILCHLLLKGDFLLIS